VEFILERSKDKFSLGDCRNLVSTVISTAIRIGGESYIPLANAIGNVYSTKIIACFKIKLPVCSNRKPANIAVIGAG
jgi:hypothetical protein